MAVKKTYASINSLTTADKQKLKNAILELNDSFTRQSAESDLQRDVLKQVSEDLNLEKKMVGRIAKTYFKSNFNNEVEANKLFEEFYSILINSGV